MRHLVAVLGEYFDLTLDYRVEPEVVHVFVIVDYLVWHKVLLRYDGGQLFQCIFRKILLQEQEVLDRLVVYLQLDLISEHLRQLFENLVQLLVPVHIHMTLLQVLKVVYGSPLQFFAYSLLIQVLIQQNKVFLRLLLLSVDFLYRTSDLLKNVREY